MRKFSFISLLLLLSCIHGFAKKILIGNGSGYLDYAGAGTKLLLQPGDTVAIRPGTYAGFVFSGVQGTAAKPIVIQNHDGLVQFSGNQASQFSEARHVVFSGAGAKTITHGFYFRDLSFRALELQSSVDSLTIAYTKFERVADYTVRINADQVYNGTAATLIEGLRFLHLSFKKTGTPIDWGNFSYANDYIGFGLNIEIAYCTFDSLAKGDGIRLNKVFNADIHHNRFTDTGLELTSTHPGVMYLRGNGQVHHNFCSNIWGNGLRAEGVGFLKVGSYAIYNNIFLGSRKYSAIEVQTLPNEIKAPYTYTCDYFVYHNTMGNQTARDYSASMVDVYALTGGKCAIKNNLGFNIEKDKPYSPTKNYIFNRQSAHLPDTARNLYRPTYTALGLKDTLQAFLLPSSPAIDKGVAVAMVVDDFAGVPRMPGAPADLGAREYEKVITDLAEVAVQNNETEMNCYPNPTKHSVVVTSRLPMQLLRLVNSQGIELWSQALLEQTSYSVHLEHFPSGMYFLIAETSAGTYTRSIVKHP